MSNEIPYQSQLGVEIFSVVQVTGKDIIQKIYATDLYVYIEIAGNHLVYLPEKGQYIVDTTQNKLKKIDVSTQTEHFRQIQLMIGKLFVQENLTEQGRHIQLKNSNSSIIQLEMDAEIISVERLDETVYHSFGVFQSKMQPTLIQMQPNEIIKSSHTIFTISGQTQESYTRSLSIKILENPCIYDYCLKWEIIS